VWHTRQVPGCGGWPWSQSLGRQSAQRDRRPGSGIPWVGRIASPRGPPASLAQAAGRPSGGPHGGSGSRPVLRKPGGCPCPRAAAGGRGRLGRRASPLPLPLLPLRPLPLARVLHSPALPPQRPRQTQEDEDQRSAPTTAPAPCPGGCSPAPVPDSGLPGQLPPTHLSSMLPPPLRLPPPLHPCQAPVPAPGSAAAPATPCFLPTLPPASGAAQCRTPTRSVPEAGEVVCRPPLLLRGRRHTSWGQYPGDERAAPETPLPAATACPFQAPPLAALHPAPPCCALAPAEPRLARSSPTGRGGSSMP